jgi:beta-xylosidase
LYAARNTLTHRILGPKSSGTIVLDISNMADGDRAGLSMLRDVSASIGVKQTGSTRELFMINGMTMNSNWGTASTGNEVATAALSGNQVWLRATADIAPGGSNSATFSYSTDGSTFTNLGDTLTMNTDWQFFMGYRFGIFNFATTALGGSVTVKSFEMQEA